MVGPDEHRESRGLFDVRCRWMQLLVDAIDKP